MLPSNLVTNAITTLKTNPPKSEVVLKHLSHTLVAILICPSIYPLITPATTYTCTLYVPEWTSPVHTQTLQNAFVRKLTWESLGIEPETFKSQVQHNYHAISTQPPHPHPPITLPTSSCWPHTTCTGQEICDRWDSSSMRLLSDTSSCSSSR